MGAPSFSPYRAIGTFGVLGHFDAVKGGSGWYRGGLDVVGDAAFTVRLKTGAGRFNGSG